jgi:hypothetical protein
MKLLDAAEPLTSLVSADNDSSEQPVFYPQLYLLKFHTKEKVNEMGDKMGDEFLPQFWAEYPHIKHAYLNYAHYARVYMTEMVFAAQNICFSAEQEGARLNDLYGTNYPELIETFFSIANAYVRSGRYVEDSIELIRLESIGEQVKKLPINDNSFRNICERIRSLRSKFPDKMSFLKILEICAQNALSPGLLPRPSLNPPLKNQSERQATIDQQTKLMPLLINDIKYSSKTRFELLLNGLDEDLTTRTSGLRFEDVCGLLPHYLEETPREWAFRMAGREDFPVHLTRRLFKALGNQMAYSTYVASGLELILRPLFMTEQPFPIMTILSHKDGNYLRSGSKLQTTFLHMAELAYQFALRETPICPLSNFTNGSKGECSLCHHLR